MSMSQVRVLIPYDLDIIKPSETVTSQGQVLMYMLNEDGIEHIINGWNIVVCLNNVELSHSTQCKNGKNGWVEYLNDTLGLTKKEGNVQVFLCVPFVKNEKPPKIDILVSDMILNNAKNQG